MPSGDGQLRSRIDGGEEVLQELKGRISIRNIRQSLLLILSSFAFMALNLQRDPQKLIALPAALLFIVLFFSQAAGIREKLRKVRTGIKAYAAASAAGTCLYAAQSFISRTGNALESRQTILVLTVLSVAAALLSLVAVYTLTALLLDHVVHVLTPLLRELTGTEIAVCIMIAAALAGYSIFAFWKSTAFWDSGMSYEVIYTSDSPSMIEPNVFLWLYHPENDIRQPLFAVFSAPLIAPAYILALPFAGLSRMAVPLLMNLFQIALLVLTNLMLTGMLRLGKRSRICFMLITSVLYTTLLFSIMIEQYIIAYFWLIFAAYSYTAEGKTSVIAVSAAGGTLLTSLAFMPLAYRAETDGKGFRSFLEKMVKAAAGFLTLFLACGRLDTLMGFSKKADVLASFTGGRSITERANQYLSFVSSCFAAPDAAADTFTYGHPSWQMTGQNVLNTDYIGLILLLLCAVSVILNRREKAVRIAGAWAAFSVLLLLVIGWGAPENGMILYTLYFGWAFLVLLFRLAEWLAAKMNFGLLTPLLTCTIVALLGLHNFRGIGELLAFAVSNYPA